MEGPGEFQAPHRLDDRQHRGLGLPLMAQLADHLALYSGPRGGTLVGLTFYRPGAKRERAPLPPSMRELVQGNELISAITENAPVGMYVLDADMRFRWANRAYQAILDERYRWADITGLPIKQVVPHAVQTGIFAALQEVSRSGAPRLREEYRIDSLNRGPTWWRRSLVPLRGDKSAPPYDVLAILSEETERKRTEEALRESQAGLAHELRTTLTLLRTADAIADWTDLASVFGSLLEAVLKTTGHTRATFGVWDAVARRVEVVASAGLQPMPRFSAPLSDFSPAFQRAARTMVTTVVDYDRLSLKQKALADSLHVRLALVVPLVYRQSLVGLLYVDDPDAKTDFSEGEIRLIEGIAAQAAVAIETARLFETQRNIAEVLQQILLEVPRTIPGVQLSHLYHSATEEAQVGGDFYDIIELDGGAAGLVIGDVSGHGVEAARIATFVKDVVYAFATRGRGPGGILSDVNDALLRKGVAGFVTVMVALLSPDRRHLAFCSAGHPSLVRRAAKGNATLLIRNYSPPLGLFPDWSCSVGEVELNPGDLLLLYTDGVIEARGGSELFGESRLLRWLDRRADVEVHSLPAALLADVLKFSGGNLHDDAAIVAVEIGGR